MMQPKDLINIDAFNRLAAEAPDAHWREIRIYVRKGLGGRAEIRFGKEARVAQILDEETMQ